MSASQSPDSGLPAPKKHPRNAVLLLWVLVFAAVPVVVRYDIPAFDAAVYLNAMHSVRVGHDPYADAIAEQQRVHDQLHGAASLNGPYSYVYSPITLPIVRLAGLLPIWLVAILFWSIYLAGILTEVWFGTKAQEPGERRYLQFFAPMAAFFPGFLGSDSVLSGNIAFMVYAVVLVAARVGWLRGRWLWFYLAVLAASCFKAPLLTLLVLPLFSARKQWLPASVTGAAGLALFAIQPLIWPSLFHNYLQAVALQFSYNRDFGFSPAGLFSAVLFDHHLAYSPAGSIFYLAYAVPLFFLMLCLGKRFLAGRFTLNQWIPVLLLGTILMNPRLIEYDVAPLAIPLAIIGYRFFAIFAPPSRAFLYLAFLFVAVNAVALSSWGLWKLTAGPLLVAFFVVGVYTLLKTSPRAASYRVVLPEPVASQT